MKKQDKKNDFIKSFSKSVLVTSLSAVFTSMVLSSAVQASDIEINAKRICKQKKKLSLILSENSKQSLEKIIHDCDRDYYLDPLEALEYGLIDEII